MTLELNGIEVECIIGDMPEERERMQRVVVDASLEICDDAALSDALNDTVDYAELVESIRSALIETRCRMIERAAKVVWDVCRRNAKVRFASVKVTKPNPVLGLASASATYSGQA